MAETRHEIELVRVKEFNKAFHFSAEAFRSPGMYLQISVEHLECKKMLLLFYVSSADPDKEITIKAGDGFMSSNKDLVIGIGVEGYVAVVVESGLYKQTKGEYKGKVLIDSPSDYVGVMAVEIP